ncbi:leucyl/phenylalanyl-tRNA--protein transferase [Paraglaciecola aquimarina]|uniref:leucyl/phenylalanyl-tRNA--protein transferase n=1 Tax=Paraglaciecola aquimarina TaxID=1235557 RepID=UPI003D169499
MVLHLLALATTLCLMLTLTQLDQDLTFPPCHYALEEPNGLLAFGGDLTPERLLAAYSKGIFPWFSEEEPIMWWSPDPRGILLIDEFKCSKSLRKFARNCGFKVSVNLAFDYRSLMHAQLSLEMTLVHG